MSESNNAEPNSGGEAQQAGRQIIVHAQYIKDLSFENPNARHPDQPATAA